MATDRSLLFGIPQELNEHEIYSRLSLKELGLFAQTSRAAEKSVAFLRLLLSAINAEPESYMQTETTKLAAIAILKRHPELLFVKGLVIDHYGRKILASCYQLFCGAGDIWALKQIHKIILPLIKDGEVKAAAQFKEQFPDCTQPFDPELHESLLYDDRNKEQIAQVKIKLKVIEEKITRDRCINTHATLEETKNAVEELREIYLPKEGEVIRTGLHFPFGILKEIFNLYDNQLNFHLCNQHISIPHKWTDNQLVFFTREVIAPATAALSAVDGQSCKLGFNRLDMKVGPDRSDGLFCRHPKGIPNELAPIKDKIGRSMYVSPAKGESCFLTSVPHKFDWYTKKGKWHEPGVSRGGWVSYQPELQDKWRGLSLSSHDI